MAGDRRTGEDVDLEAVLAALDDPDARRLVEALSEPMTARELSDATDIPLSTTYRKLDGLTEASLLYETTQVRSDGHHTTRYIVAFEEIHISLTDDRELEVAVERREQAADERLAALWAEVRKET